MKLAVYLSILLAALVAMMVSFDQVTDTVERTAPVAAAALSAPPAHELSGNPSFVRVDGDRATTRTAVPVESPVESRRPTTDEPEASGSVRVHGTVEAFEADGHGPFLPSGKMWLRIRDQNRPVEVDVRAGLWEAEVPAGASFYPTYPFFDDRAATFGSSWEQTVPLEDGSYAYRARWPAPLILRVVASDTGKELRDIQLIAGAYADGRRPIEWDDDDVVHEAAFSPITLPVPDYEDDMESYGLFARAPGYGWAKIDVDASRGGERLMVLRPSGAIDVRISGIPSVSVAALLLREKSSPLDETVLEEWFDGGDAELSFDSIAEGRYEASVSLEYFGDEDRVVLASARFDVLAGERANVKLEVEELVVPPLVPFRGTLVLPFATTEYVLMWVDRIGTAVRAQEIDIWPALHGEGTTRTFDLGACETGEYELYIEPFHHVVTIDLATVGPTGAHVVVPELSRVHVRFVHAETGAPIDTIERLSWMPDGVQSYRVAPDDVDRDADGAFSFTAPAAPTRIWGRAWETVGGPFELLAGECEVEVPVRKWQGEETYLELVLRDGTSLIPDGDYAWSILLEPLDEHGEFYYLGGHDEGAVLHASPGRYRLSLPPLNGFRPVPPVIVELTSPGPTRHVFDLERVFD